MGAPFVVEGNTMGQFITPEDLPTIKAEDVDAVIFDLEALALIDAPCIGDPMFDYRDGVKAILRQAGLRWARAGEGGVTSGQMNSGPFGFNQTFDTRVSGEGRLWPSEVRQLQKLCRLHNGSGSGRKASTLVPGRGVLR